MAVDHGELRLEAFQRSRYSELLSGCLVCVLMDAGMFGASGLPPPPAALEPRQRG